MHDGVSDNKKYNFTVKLVSFFILHGIFTLLGIFPVSCSSSGCLTSISKMPLFLFSETYFISSYAAMLQCSVKDENLHFMKALFIIEVSFG